MAFLVVGEERVVNEHRSHTTHKRAGYSGLYRTRIIYHPYFRWDQKMDGGVDYCWYFNTDL
jgi:hypothetical protein